MDTELFEGIDEQHKAEFVGNFFHFVKCRFQDCNNLAQVKSHSTNKSKQPTVAETVTREDAQDLKDWGSGKGVHTQAYHSPEQVQYVGTAQPTVAETVTREDAQDLKDWGSGKGIHTQAYHTPDEVQYAQGKKDQKQKPTNNAQVKSENKTEQKAEKKVEKKEEKKVEKKEEKKVEKKAEAKK